MHKLLKLDNIMYRVTDLQKSARLYTEALGLKQVWEDRDAKMVGLQLHDGSTEIVLHADPDLPPFDFSFLVKDVDGFICDAIENGFTLSMGPIDVRSGRYAVLEDPDKNKIPVIDLSKFGGVPKYD